MLFKRQGLRGATGQPWEEAAGLGDLVAGHEEQATGRGGHRRKTGADNGEPRRRKEKEMEKRSNGDEFVRRDISRRIERRDLPLGAGGCHHNATVCPEKLTGSLPET